MHTYNLSVNRNGRARLGDLVIDSWVILKQNQRETGRSEHLNWAKLGQDVIHRCAVGFHKSRKNNKPSNNY
jgi:hypothetical protein